MILTSKWDRSKAKAAWGDLGKEQLGTKVSVQCISEIVDRCFCPDFSRLSFLLEIADFVRALIKELGIVAPNKELEDVARKFHDCSQKIRKQHFAIAPIGQHGRLRVQCK